MKTVLNSNKSKILEHDRAKKSIPISQKSKSLARKMKKTFP